MEEGRLSCLYLLYRCHRRKFRKDRKYWALTFLMQGDEFGECHTDCEELKIDEKMFYSSLNVPTVLSHSSSVSSINEVGSFGTTSQFSKARHTEDVSTQRKVTNAR
jgi:hypothetical protein